MVNNNYSALMTMAKTATNGAMCSLILLTDVRVKKDCPIANIKKLAVYKNIQFGTSYENGVNNVIDRLGINTDEEFQACPLKGKKWFEYPRIEQSLKDENQFYVRFNLCKNTNVTSCYIVDGRKATTAEVAVIEKYLYSSSHASARQSEIGIAEVEQKKPFSPKFESIVSWTCKNTYYNNELVAEAISALAKGLEEALAEAEA